MVQAPVSEGSAGETYSLAFSQPQTLFYGVGAASLSIIATARHYCSKVCRISAYCSRVISPAA
jgi:hypothetical protein